MKLQIKITKDILKRSMMCGTEEGKRSVKYSSQNCAIALAVREIFPHARVYGGFMFFTKSIQDMAFMTKESSDFIREFDSLVLTPEKRIELPEFSFEIDVPEEVIDTVGVEEAIRIVEGSEYLSFV